MFVFSLLHYVAAFGMCNSICTFQWVVLIQCYSEVLMKVLGTEVNSQLLLTHFYNSFVILLRAWS